MNFDLNCFTQNIICEDECIDVKTETVINGNTLELYITANESKPRFVELQWNFASKDDVYVLGDAWERSYGELEFRKLCDIDRNMPWYFIATDKKTSFCFGVKTQPNAFVGFTYKADGIKALVDCRNGSCGVELNGRKTLLATFVYKKIALNLESFNCKILTDEKWITFVIEQVLSNALKYTNSGSISIYMD